MFEALRHAWHAFVSIPHLPLMLFIAWLVYVVWLAAWIILQKREPIATLSWLLSLALLPYVGAIVYLVFGPQKIRRQRLRRDRNVLPRENTGLVHKSDSAAEIGALAQATSGLPESSAHSVQLLIDGGETYASLIKDIGQARHHVHLEYYIFGSGSSGTAMRDALIERARAGVKVRLLLDAVGSVKTKDAFFDELVAAGGELAWFHPSRFGRFWTRSWINMRTHRKIVVIDSRIGYTGGINITDDENDTLRDDAYRDLHLRIEGDAVRSLQLVFVEDWMYATGERNFVEPLSRDLPSLSKGAIATQVVASGPDSPWEAIHRVHVAAIYAATSRVWLVTPYFVPGEAALMALTSAAKGGLDVRLLIPRRSDSRMVTLAARSYFDELLGAGVRIFEYGPRMLHTKAMLVDDCSALIGTANFDYRSFRLNFEVSVLFQDKGIAGQLADHIEFELASAQQVRDDRERPLFTARLPEAVARLGSPML